MNRLGPNRPNFTTIAREIRSIAKLCVPYFTKNLIVWAPTLIAKVRWWERKESRLLITWYGEPDSLMSTTTPWTNLPAATVKGRCMAIISNIANGHLQNWRAYTPSAVGIRIADLDWASGSYLMELEYEADRSRRSDRRSTRRDRYEYS